MNLNVLNAKIKRNNLEEYAGKYFRDHSSEIIQTLIQDGKDALFGIENKKKELYTIIGKSVVYYKANSGNTGELALNKFSDLLHSNAMVKGKRARYKYLSVGDADQIWLNNRNTMNGLWNIILWLEKRYIG